MPDRGSAVSTRDQIVPQRGALARRRAEPPQSRSRRRRRPRRGSSPSARTAAVVVSSPGTTRTVATATEPLATAGSRQLGGNGAVEPHGFGVHQPCRCGAPASDRTAVRRRPPRPCRSGRIRAPRPAGAGRRRRGRPRSNAAAAADRTGSSPAATRRASAPASTVSLTSTTASGSSVGRPSRPPRW